MEGLFHRRKNAYLENVVCAFEPMTLK